MLIKEIITKLRLQFIALRKDENYFVQIVSNFEQTVSPKKLYQTCYNFILDEARNEIPSKDCERFLSDSLNIAFKDNGISPSNEKVIRMWLGLQNIANPDSLYATPHKCAWIARSMDVNQFALYNRARRSIAKMLRYPDKLKKNFWEYFENCNRLMVMKRVANLSLDEQRTLFSVYGIDLDRINEYSDEIMFKILDIIAKLSINKSALLEENETITLTEFLGCSDDELREILLPRNTVNYPFFTAIFGNNLDKSVIKKQIDDKTWESLKTKRRGSIRIQIIKLRRKRQNNVDLNDLVKEKFNIEIDSKYFNEFIEYYKHINPINYQVFVSLFPAKDTNYSSYINVSRLGFRKEIVLNVLNDLTSYYEDFIFQNIKSTSLEKPDNYIEYSVDDAFKILNDAITSKAVVETPFNNPVYWRFVQILPYNYRSLVIDAIGLINGIIAIETTCESHGILEETVVDGISLFQKLVEKYLEKEEIFPELVDNQKSVVVEMEIIENVKEPEILLDTEYDPIKTPFDHPFFKEFVNILPDESRKYTALRLGITDGKIYTISQIAQMYGADVKDVQTAIDNGIEVFMALVNRYKEKYKNDFPNLNGESDLYLKLLK